MSPAHRLTAFKSHLKALNWSPEDAARELGRHRTTVYRWLRKASNVPAWVIRDLAQRAPR